MKAKIIFKGGPGSGHHGHAGIPGKRGGSLPGSGYLSDRATREIKGGLFIDEAISELVHDLRAAGVETSHSCSGHVCDKPLESQLSFRIRTSKPTDDGTAVSRRDMREYSVYESIRDVVNSDSLELQWTLEKRPGSAYEYTRFELYPSGGLYGSATAQSSDVNVRAAVRDFQKIRDVISQGD